MVCTKIGKYSLLLLLYATTLRAEQDNSKFLGKDYPEDRFLGKRRRPSSQGSNPCNFGNGYQRPKNQGTGRTFFDFQFFNVEHNYNLEINCGGNGGHYPSNPHPAPVTETHHHDVGSPLGGIGNHQGGGHRPPRPFHKPHKPMKPGGGGFFQGLFGGGNRPQHGESGDPHQAGTGPFNGVFAGIFPSPHQFGTGLSEGIQGFVGTIPDIGQSFQSILPSFDNFQWPQLPSFQWPQLPNFQGPQSPQSIPGGNTGPQQFGPVFPGGVTVPSNTFNGPPSFTAPSTTFRPVLATTPAFVTSSTPTTTTDPDDIIYSDEIKPVHEDYDPITDPYSNRPSDNLSPGQYVVISNPHLGSYTQDISVFNPTNIHKKWTQGVQEVLEELGGANGRYRPNSYYSRRNGYQQQNYRQPSDQYNGRSLNDYKNQRSSSFLQDRPEGRTFRFPS